MDQKFAGAFNVPNSSSFTAIASTTTETNVANTTGAAAQFAGIPAQHPEAGSIYKVNFGGVISTTGTPTVIWTPRWGQSDTATSNTTLGASPTITTVTGLSSHIVNGEFMLVFRAIGNGSTAGTAVGTGWVKWGNAAAAATVATMGGTVATNLSTNSAQGLMISLTWGTSSASNTFTCLYYSLQSLN